MMMIIKKNQKASAFFVFLFLAVREYLIHDIHGNEQDQQSSEYAAEPEYHEFQ